VRIDQALHWLCLVKSRSMAMRACREGRVLIDGQAVRPSRDARAGEGLILLDPARVQARHITLLEVPTRQCSRKEAGRRYRLDRIEALDDVASSWGVPPEAEDE
jgi:ribosomal 50S subunit-recycling heat shock protein